MDMDDYNTTDYHDERESSRDHFVSRSGNSQSKLLNSTGVYSFTQSCFAPREVCKVESVMKAQAPTNIIRRRLKMYIIPGTVCATDMMCESMNWV
jgi:hypothetical protein